MEGEIKNFIVLWCTVLASLCFCHTIGKFIPRGTTRLFAMLPIISLFLYLPLTLYTLHLGATTSFFIGWLATFKLFLFAFGEGPLSSTNSLLSFILLACLPINIQNNSLTPNSEKHQNTEIKEYPSRRVPKQCHKSPLNYVIKVVIVALLVEMYRYKEYLHDEVIIFLYCLNIYLALEILLAVMAALARALARVELEPPFDEPYLSSSLQDFWGRRWNLIVSSILRLTIYDPVRSIFTHLIGREWASVPAVLATFFVSGVMHEMILYNVGRVKPTGEIMCFFLIHGVCLALEICIKRGLNGKFRFPPIVSGPLVISFVVVTSLWLFMPPSLRCKADEMAYRETAVFMEFVKDIARTFRSRSSKFT